MLPFLLTVKKPSPSIAMSRLRPVGSMLPCENCWATLLSLTPEPIALRDRPYDVYENRSANSARDSLKPAVLTLAMLLAVTFRSALAALMPESEVLKLMVDSVDAVERRAGGESGQMTRRT